ncbi:MAG: hypothetical protein K2X27_01650, partial [Candidatus Obscuribacterales bacterium]|nr:hypothetical protein [Candidatus Obscuribacterales bacterium]
MPEELEQNNKKEAENKPTGTEPLSLLQLAQNPPAAESLSSRPAPLILAESSLRCHNPDFRNSSLKELSPEPFKLSRQAFEKTASLELPGNEALRSYLEKLFRPAPKEIDEKEALPKLIINGKEEKYPKSKRLDIVDQYNSKEVADPYQWLEKPKEADTKDWVKKQSELTEKYLAGIPERAELHKRLEQIYDYEQRFNMWRQGNKYYVWKQDGLKQQPELCVMDNLQGKAETILDPNKLSKDGHGIVRDLVISQDGRYARFNFADGGQDKARRVFYDLKAQKEIAGEPKSAKFNHETDTRRAELPDGSLRDYELSTEGNGSLTYRDSKSGERKTVLPETQNKLLEAQIIGNKILAHYLKNACSELKVFDLDGKVLKEIDLPIRGTVKSIKMNESEKSIFFNLSNFSNPNTIYSCDLESGKLETIFK